MDTLRMHRSPLDKNLSNKGQSTDVYRITFSIISNGVESAVTNEDGDEVEMFMVGNSFHDEKGDNSLKKDEYELSFDQMSGHTGEEGWENTIRVTDFGVFIHRASDVAFLSGCKALCSSVDSKRPDRMNRDDTEKALETVRSIHDKHKDNLKGPNNFVLKTNSTAPKKRGHSKVNENQY